jgi:hypothetical protein
MSNPTATDVEGTTPPIHESKHGCCGSKAVAGPRTGAAAPAGQCGAPAETDHRAHETTSAPDGSCCCGAAATRASKEGPGVKSKLGQKCLRFYSASIERISR